MKVEFTDLAEESLQKIFCRYPKNVAEKIIEKIPQRSETLSSFSSRGRIVEELRSLKQGHRFVLEGNYKIIYLINDDKVYVTDVFNMSQNPKMIREKHQK